MLNPASRLTIRLNPAGRCESMGSQCRCSKSMLILSSQGPISQRAQR